MIVTTQKPLDEILSVLSPYKKLLVIGCDGCTQPPRGLREAKTISKLLELGGKLGGKTFTFHVATHAKQCDSHLVESMVTSDLDDVDAVITLACGIGVQTLAALNPAIPVFPKIPMQETSTESVGKSRAWLAPFSDKASSASVITLLLSCGGFTNGM